MALFRSVATVGSLTMVSRVFGFVRDILTAAILGAGPVADAFFVAQRLPNLFRSLFAEGAFSAAFVPLATRQKAARRRCGNSRKKPTRSWWRRWLCSSSSASFSCRW
jgi:putative peptidoglycan lipid II flippase